ncbi:hypothetical protein wcw_1340 [Waddlia chondrophila WSU 86-1044]|uniref:Uncharacterized protein n=1 Tax=Waddlia chondrophila (strain ATCC VR-1470 / WSU 86-1044) TaxID=716544 RepID=D6YRJ7_WADCW|nr:hypothetical protein wcw_1340 [Waddlia chondrophila WSU 86-1044]
MESFCFVSTIIEKSHLFRHNTKIFLMQIFFQTHAL